MLALTTALAAIFALQDGPIPPTAYDRVVELEITAEAPLLIEGRGPTIVYEYEAEFSGTLHVWTRSELDLYLRVEDATAQSILSEDDNSGGGKTPYVKLSVKAGDKVAVSIASKEIGALELHLVAAPESEPTLEAAKKTQAGLEEARRLQGEADLDAARALVEGLTDEVLAVTDAKHSESVSEVLWGLGLLARELNHRESCRMAWAAAASHRERTLPEGNSDLLAVRLNLSVTMRHMGDLPGARALQEAVVEGFERTLPEGHLNLLRARMLLSSLWSVKDESTADLMRDFYKNLWLKGMGRLEALRSAQLAMLNKDRMEHGDPLPSTWGAFVLSGEWR